MPDERRYDVHLFAVVRRKITDVLAASPREAIEIARRSAEVARWLRVLEDPQRIGEFADEFSHYLVDVVGDDEFNDSRWLHDAQSPLLKPLWELVAWDEQGRDPCAIDQLLADVRQILAELT